jgi:PadR family transcriptional regulator
MPDETLELMKGTLDVLVLKTLSWEPMHGYAVSRWIRRRTEGMLDVEDAALYQALHRMERRGWLESEWGRSENNRRAKFYRLTPKGRTQLGRQTRDVRRYVVALTRVLDARGLGAVS